MKDIMETFGSKGFIKPQKADYYELPQEFWGENNTDNLFVDIGKSIGWLYSQDLQHDGYIDLDKAWIDVDLKVLVGVLLGEDAPAKQIKSMEAQLAELRTKYPTPYKNRKLYYGFVRVNHLAKISIEFEEMTDKSSKGEKYDKDRVQVSFYVCHYNHDNLGYKPPQNKPATLGGGTDESKEILPYTKINFFLSPEQHIAYLQTIADTQHEDGEKREIEFCFVISKELFMKGKFLNGYINDLWC